MSYHNVQLRHTVIQLLKQASYSKEDLICKVQEIGCEQKREYQEGEILQNLKFLKSLDLLDVKANIYTWKGW